jgi:hypothetical protein
VYPQAISVLVRLGEGGEGGVVTDHDPLMVLQAVVGVKHYVMHDSVPHA